MSLAVLPFTTLIPVVLLVNLPQMIISILFLTYNAIFTCELIAAEWNKFANDHHPLRVTAPKGQQRSTHYLGLPFRYAIPLAAVSAILHWFTSQSFFLADLAFFGSDGQEANVYQDPEDSTRIFSRFDPYGQSWAVTNTMYRAGYSSIAIICTIILGTLVVIVGLGFGFRRYSPGIPLVGSCSVAIAAACHPLSSEPEDLAELPLKWGLVGRRENGEVHYSFTAGIAGAVEIVEG
jgi:hypothetical protein